MLTDMPSISHQEQQKAAEKVHQLISTGMSSAEVITLVAQEIRMQHKDDPQVTLFFDDDLDDDLEKATKSIYRQESPL